MNGTSGVEACVMLVTVVGMKSRIGQVPEGTSRRAIKSIRAPWLLPPSSYIFVLDS